ncbi:cation-dependent mannose-6-phosphate receptor-like [Lytechinus pictus]|uniref:cation-dependent mannose-6-phosphate receptor-like n=1 Tax=Lytechinus pictus TaxID=7653 RepID=UPI0030B9F0DF
MDFSGSKMSCFVFLFCLFACVQSVLSDCSVAHSEKKYLSLIEPLKGKTVEVMDPAHNYSYKVGFCDGIHVDGVGAEDIGVEQFDLKEDKAPLHAVGRITATNIMVGTNWIFLEYRNGDAYNSHCNGETRRATIFILCDKSGLLVKPVLVEENNNRTNECAYVFEVGSSVACSNSTTSPSSSGIGVGGIIVISTLVIAAAYLILGVAYKRFFLRAKGREQFPNIDFWTNFGNLTADGCDFLCRCNKKQPSKSYKGLGDDQLGLDEEEERDDNILPMY